jgi:hypothetical protein
LHPFSPHTAPTIKALVSGSLDPESRSSYWPFGQLPAYCRLLYYKILLRCLSFAISVEGSGLAREPWVDSQRGRGRKQRREKVFVELWFDEAYIKDNRELKIIFDMTLLTHFRSNY